MFDISSNKKIIYLILIIAVAMSIINSGANGIMQIIMTIPGILIAMTFHEFAHAYVAYKLGDYTVKSEGRLSLNPIKHIDPIGFLMLIAVGFGWGKPVHINPNNFDRSKSIEKAEAKVAIAGPIMNFIIAFVSLLIFLFLVQFNSNAMEQFIQYQYGTSILNLSWIGIISILIYITALINIGLGVFNLIPLPPLDGSKVLMAFLPYKAKQWFYNNENIFSLIFIVLVIFGALSFIMNPLINGVYYVLATLARLIVGVFI